MSSQFLKKKRTQHIMCCERLSYVSFESSSIKKARDLKILVTMNKKCIKSKKKKWLEREVVTLAMAQLVTSNKLGEQVIKLKKLGLIVILVKLTAFWNIYSIFSL